jgi:hypothetical protein
MDLFEVHESTYILAEGLSPSGLSFCHLYGFCAVSKAQASDKTRFPVPEDASWAQQIT